jgi:phospho-N-acetylmuramoyl-pentapeptide-transferase
MLYHLFYPLRDHLSFLNIFKYITFRTFGALLTALVIYFVFGPLWIRYLQRKQFGQVVRDDGPQTHLAKKNTPTMGGLLIISAVIISAFLWCDWQNLYVWMVLAVMTAFAAIGFVDDYQKVIKHNSKGLRGQYKIVVEVLVCLVAALVLYGQGYLDTQIHLPFFKRVTPDLDVWYIFFAVLVVAGAANALNFTDGLDGLVSVPAIFSFLSYGILAYAAGNIVITRYLQVASVPGAGELTIICGATMGALMGFLWFNAHPAEIFMGDVGALGLGASLGMMALITKNEILLLFIGGLFVLETLSVIAQVVSFKLRKKRVLLMAPLHHHFELKGWKESKVIVRFWIIAFIFALLALATLKLR